MRRWSLVSGAVLVLLVPFTLACLPFPHHEQDSPEVEGTLAWNGAPAVGVAVTLAMNDPGPGCTQVKARTVTMAGGRFRFARTMRFVPVLAFGDRFDRCTLCFDLPDGRRRAWEGSHVGGELPRQQVACRYATAAAPAGEGCVAEPATAAR